MLVLSRKSQEIVLIIVPPCTEETLIEVQVVKITTQHHKSGDPYQQAQLGFEAPRRVTVMREELMRPPTKKEST